MCTVVLRNRNGRILCRYTCGRCCRCGWMCRRGILVVDVIVVGVDVEVVVNGGVWMVY